MFKKNFNCALWLGILNLPLACFFGLAYLPEGESPWFVLCTFFFALIGQLFVYFAIVSIILILPALNWQKKLSLPRFIYATLILVLCHALLNIDAYMYESYGQHLFDYLHQVQEHSGDWSGINWMHLGMQFIIIVGYSSLILGVAHSLSMHRSLYWPFALLILIMYFLSTGIFMFAHSRNVQPLIELESKNLPKFINIGQIVTHFKELSAEGEPVLPPAQYEPDDGSYIQPSAKWNSEREQEAVNETIAGIEEAASDMTGDTGVEATHNAEQAETTGQNAQSEQNEQSEQNAQSTPNAQSAGTSESDVASTQAESGANPDRAETPVNSIDTVDEARDPRSFNPFN